MAVNIKLVAAIATGLVVGGLSAFSLRPSIDTVMVSSAGSSGSVKKTGSALIGGAFELTDHNGKTVTNKSFAGGHTLVYFGFTYCPDVCPTGLANITTALELLGKKAKAVTPLFISLDPERDTPSKMAAYVASFHPSVVGLTGTPAQIAKTARAYRVYYAKVKNDTLPGDYTIDHSSIIYLMDENGAYVRHFSHSTSSDKMAAALAKVL